MTPPPCFNSLPRSPAGWLKLFYFALRVFVVLAFVAVHVARGLMPRHGNLDELVGPIIIVYFGCFLMFFSRGVVLLFQRRTLDAVLEISFLGLTALLGSNLMQFFAGT